MQEENDFKTSYILIIFHAIHLYIWYVDQILTCMCCYIV